MINKLTPKNLYDIWSSELECIKILDFRSPMRYLESRIPGSKSLGDQKITLRKEHFIRSSDLSFFLIEAPKHLSDMLVDDQDIENVFEIVGGFEAWVKSGYPTAPLKFKSGDKKIG